jgi:hypothetical protein
MRWQYPSKMEPVSQASERTAPDKWQSATSTPVRRRVATVALAASIAFVPVVSAAPETVTLDKYEARISQPAPRQKRPPLEQFVIDSLQLAQPERTSLDKWYSGVPQPYRTRGRPFHFGLSVIDPVQLTQPEPIRFSWLKPLEEPRRDRKRLQYLYRFSWGASLVDPPVLPMWEPGIDQPYPLRRRQPSLGQFAFPVTTTGETITLDKWQHRLSEPRTDRQRRQNLYPVFSGENLFNVPGVESITIDKWIALSAEPGRIRKRTFDYAPTQPVSVSSLEIPRLLAEISQPEARQKRRESGLFVIDTLLLAQRETLPLRWILPVNQPRFDRKRNQHLYPNLFADSQLFNAPEGAALTFVFAPVVAGAAEPVRAVPIPSAGFVKE